MEPVNAILPTPDRHSAAPTSPSAVHDLQHRLFGHHLGERVDQPLPTAGVYSLGLNTTALPAASAYAIEPIGVSTG